MEQTNLVVAYCTGLIFVCTVVLLVATVLIAQNLLALRRISETGTGGRESAIRPARTTTPTGSGSSTRPWLQRERNDSAPVYNTDATEWTGPVTTYIPADRQTS